MGKTYTKDDVIGIKKDCFARLNSLLEYYISSDDGHIKKAALIGTWIKQFSNYISFEERFDPLKNVSYKRGDVVFVNFGFNIGSEFGGGHYAVVLNNFSEHRSPNVTVVPLTSLKINKQVHSKDVFIGNELYEKLSLKLKTSSTDLQKRLDERTAILEQLNQIPSTDEREQKFNALRDMLDNQNKQLHKDLNNSKLLQQEILSLKMGSIAKVEQIRTISKIRIYNPKNTHDPLYGIRLSKETMQAINTKLKELFVFDK